MKEKITKRVQLQLFNLLLKIQVNQRCVKSKIFAQFKKIFNDIDETQIHNYYFCTERNCNEICSDDLKIAKKDNKFKHKWLFDPNIAKCDKTNKWCLVYIDRKGMFCSLCRYYDIKQSNGQET